MRKVVFLFGRFQVPTKGHEEMIRYGFNLAKRTGAEFRLYTSKSQDPVKNPLPYRQKIQFLHDLFPGINVVDDPNVKTAFDICRQLSDAGVEDVTMVVGGDRVAEFQRAIGKYVIPRSTPGFDPRKNYAFKHFTVVNSGGRKAGVSGTQMREYIKQGKFSEFMKVAPTKDKLLARKIFNAAKANLREDFTLLEEKGLSRKEFDKLLHSFIDFTCKQLDIHEKPVVEYKDDKGEGQPSFGGYAPHSKTLMVYTKNRHPMDIFRTVAHELVHHKQNLDGRLGKDIAKEGATGSKIENEANSEAGKVMRYFGRENPFYFDMNYVLEHKAILLGGVPGSGKDRILKEAITPLGYKEVSQENFTKYNVSGEGIVVNGTMSGYEQTKQIKNILESRGYKTMMVFVNTTNEVSKQRNEARALTGGRVINESVRFSKWQDAQVNASNYLKLFEHCYITDNSVDLTEEHSNNLHFLKKALHQFSLSESDYNFEEMINEKYTDFSKNNRKTLVGGAGNWGTSQLTNRYQADTPGQTIGFQPMKVLEMRRNRKMKKEEATKIGRKLSGAPIGGDRIGQEIGLPKGPGFGDNQSIDTLGLDRQIDRWMVKEETRKRFKQKYGQLAEQKIKETADKLRRESLTDPFDGSMGATPNSGQVDNVRQDPNAEFEKQGIFRRNKKLNTKSINKSKGN